MKKIFAAVLLAGAAIPAQSTTYIEYTGSGEGSGAEFFNIGPSVIPVTGHFNFTLIVGLGDSFTICPLNTTCSASSNGSVGSHNYQFSPQFFNLTLNFSDPPGGPITPGSFTGGTASGLESFYPIYSIQWNGVVTQVDVTTVQSNTNIASFSGQFSAYATPEPATWALMITGFAMAGGALRRKRTLAIA